MDGAWIGGPVRGLIDPSALTDRLSAAARSDRLRIQLGADQGGRRPYLGAVGPNLRIGSRRVPPARRIYSPAGGRSSSTMLSFGRKLARALHAASETVRDRTRAFSTTRPLMRFSSLTLIFVRLAYR